MGSSWEAKVWECLKINIERAILADCPVMADKRYHAMVDRIMHTIFDPAIEMLKETDNGKVELGTKTKVTRG